MSSKSSSVPSVIGRTPTRRLETLETPRAWASTTRSSVTRSVFFGSSTLCVLVLLFNQAGCFLEHVLYFILGETQWISQSFGVGISFQLFGGQFARGTCLLTVSCMCLSWCPNKDFDAGKELNNGRFAMFPGMEANILEDEKRKTLVWGCLVSWICSCSLKTCASWSLLVPQADSCVKLSKSQIVWHSGHVEEQAHSNLLYFLMSRFAAIGIISADLLTGKDAIQQFGWSPHLNWHRFLREDRILILSILFQVCAQLDSCNILSKEV